MTQTELDYLNALPLPELATRASSALDDAARSLLLRANPTVNDGLQLAGVLILRLAVRVDAIDRALRSADVLRIERDL